MKLRKLTLGASGTAPVEALIMIAALMLTLFHYWTRADLLGVAGPGRGWVALSGRPLPSTVHWTAAGLLLGLAPLLGARWLCGLRPAQVGLGAGDRRAGLIWMAAGVPVAAALGRLAAADPAMRAVYPLDPDLAPGTGALARHAALLLVYYVAWETLFRGVLLLGLRRRLGPRAANALQTALSVTAHFARPPLETLASAPAGLALGAVSLRARSIWPAVVIHWVAGLTMDACIVLKCY